MDLPLAYLDPGAGSLILQVLLGTIAAAWVFFRQMGDQIKAWFSRAPRVTEAPPEASPVAEATKPEPPA